MLRLNRFSVRRKAEAIQRSTILPFCQCVTRRAPQMFAWEVAILCDKYREIDHLRCVCNQGIDPIRAKVCREFPINASRWA
jgi:hypothetical protein